MNKIIKLIALCLFFPNVGYTNGIVVKENQCTEILSGSICYSAKEIKDLDETQKAALNCQSKLKTCQDKLPTPVLMPFVAPKSIYQKQWFRDTVLGVILLSTGVMIGVGISE